MVVALAMKEKHEDEEFLKVLNCLKARRIGSTGTRLMEDLNKQFEDDKLRFYNSLKSSQLTKDEHQRKLDSIHKTERLFQIDQLLNCGDEKLGFEDKIERMKEVIRLVKDFKAEGIDVGIAVPKFEKEEKMFKKYKVFKLAEDEYEINNHDLYQGIQLFDHQVSPGQKSSNMYISEV